MADRIVADPKEVGPFFVGDQLPNLFCELYWDTGGAVDLADWPNASFVVTRVKGTATVMSGSKSGGDITYQVTSNGELTITWSAVFSEPGFYQLRLTLLDVANKPQSVQAVRWEVQER